MLSRHIKGPRCFPIFRALDVLLHVMNVDEQTTSRGSPEPRSTIMRMCPPVSAAL